MSTTARIWFTNDFSSSGDENLEFQISKAMHSPPEACLWQPQDGYPEYVLPALRSVVSANREVGAHARLFAAYYIASRTDSDGDPHAQPTMPTLTSARYEYHVICHRPPQSPTIRMREYNGWQSVREEEEPTRAEAVGAPTYLNWYSSSPPSAKSALEAVDAKAYWSPQDKPWRLVGRWWGLEPVIMYDGADNGFLCVCDLLGSPAVGRGPDEAQAFASFRRIVAERLNCVRTQMGG